MILLILSNSVWENQLPNIKLVDFLIQYFAGASLVIITTFNLALAFGIMYTSWWLVLGVEEVQTRFFSIICFVIYFSHQLNHKKIQPSRIVANASYVLVFIEILVIGFSDLMKDGIVEAYAARGQHLAEAQIDENDRIMKTIFFILLLVGILIDFVYRHFVIDSLQHKHKKQRKPNQVLKKCF